MTSFKAKYHSDLATSKKYIAREYEALSKLVKYLGDLVRIEKCGKAVGQVGVVDDPSPCRFDFVLKTYFSGAVVAFIEVTGDDVNDDYARILLEKYERARGCRKPVIFLYNKKRSWRWVGTAFITTLLSLKKVEVRPWIEGEKPYVFIPIKYLSNLKELRKFIQQRLYYIQTQVI